SDEILESHRVPDRRVRGAGGWETRARSASWDSPRTTADEGVGRGDVDDDGAAAILLGAEANALRAGAHDLAEVQPSEVEEAPHRARREETAPGTVERRRHGLEVERDAVTAEPHEVLALRKRAVFDGQEHGEDQLRECVPLFLRVATLLVHRAHQSRRRRSR